MKCEFDDETLRLIALAIGTRNRYEKDAEIPNHYLSYIANKLVGNDGLSLDLENQEIYERLKKIVKEIEK